VDGTNHYTQQFTIYMLYMQQVSVYKGSVSDPKPYNHDLFPPDAHHINMNGLIAGELDNSQFYPSNNASH